MEYGYKRYGHICTCKNKKQSKETGLNYQSCLQLFAQEEFLRKLEKSRYAEEFDAILKRMMSTSRMKDFYDLYYISFLYNFDGRKLQEAFFETIQHRGTIYEKDSMEKIIHCENIVYAVRFNQVIEIKKSDANTLRIIKDEKSILVKKESQIGVIVEQ